MTPPDPARVEAAARALYAEVSEGLSLDDVDPWPREIWLSRAERAITAADAHDAANGVVRVLWRPIDRQSQDGSFVLLWLPNAFNKFRVARWYAPWGVWLESSIDPYPDDEICGIGSRVPTHWAELHPPSNGTLSSPDDGGDAHDAANGVVRQQWQPIATANRDHIILAWDPYYGMRVARADTSSGSWLTDLPYDFERGGKELRIQPTHWMPLPLPPDDGGDAHEPLADDEVEF